MKTSCARSCAEKHPKLDVAAALSASRPQLQHEKSSDLVMDRSKTIICADPAMHSHWFHFPFPIGQSYERRIPCCRIQVTWFQCNRLRSLCDDRACMGLQLDRNERPGRNGRRSKTTFASPVSGLFCFRRISRSSTMALRICLLVCSR